MHNDPSGFVPRECEYCGGISMPAYVPLSKLRFKLPRSPLDFRKEARGRARNTYQPGRRFCDEPVGALEGHTRLSCKFGVREAGAVVAGRLGRRMQPFLELKDVPGLRSLREMRIAPWSTLILRSARCKISAVSTGSGSLETGLVRLCVVCPTGR